MEGAMAGSAWRARFLERAMVAEVRCVVPRGSSPTRRRPSFRRCASPTSRARTTGPSSRSACLETRPATSSSVANPTAPLASINLTPHGDGSVRVALGVRREGMQIAGALPRSPVGGLRPAEPPGSAFRGRHPRRPQ
ncbi:hypothetical protein ACP70R_024301 [Stipagrostis hirtigluma subsp. patula]